MAKRLKSIDLEQIPEILEKVTAVIDREITLLNNKDQLTAEDSKNLIAYATVLTSIFKDYRAQVVAIKEELRGRSKEQLLAIVKADSK